MKQKKNYINNVTTLSFMFPVFRLLCNDIRIEL